MFFVTLRTKGRGHFDPPANSETKEDTTVKLCTVIAYYNTSITKQLKFLNSHCSIVCGYCSILCFTAKTIVKNDQISSPFKLNEIHSDDSPFDEDPKNIYFSRKALISGEGRPENLGKMGNNRDIYCYANWEVVNFERAYQPVPPGTKILVIPQFSYMPDQFLLILRKSEKEPKFDPF